MTGRTLTVTVVLVMLLGAVAAGWACPPPLHGISIAPPHGGIVPPPHGWIPYPPTPDEPPTIYPPPEDIEYVGVPDIGLYLGTTRQGISAFYADFSPQRVIELALRRQGWPWQVPPDLATEQLHHLGVTGYWQALEAYRRLFVALTPEGGSESGTAIKRDLCANALAVFDWHRLVPEAVSPTVLLRVGEAYFDLLREAPALCETHTLSPADYGLPPQLPPIACRSAAELEALRKGALQGEERPEELDPAIWAIWALNMGAVIGPEHVQALDAILGREQVSSSEALGHLLRELPGGPRYLWSVQVRDLAKTLDQEIEEALTACDSYLLDKGVNPLRQAAQQTGGVLLRANASPWEAELLFYSYLQPGAAWHVDCVYRASGRLPAKLRLARCRPAESWEDFLAVVIGEQPGSYLQAMPQIDMAKLTRLTQVVMPEQEPRYWQLQGAGWVPVALRLAAAPGE